ncbi:hypothetical protein C0Q70_11833 [Pomacea canaliculata]|uniref:Major facilitator superfamily (MFS) profile domain-containing protein n=1 Tax=Pomacea canaliculata TaxID=400727 RepID=A0A2T7P764_POMCA|nr:hypothetical protein C0Q70_11833 [Pomacea canaliculata]
MKIGKQKLNDHFGKSLNVGSLSGGIYINFLYASIAETLSYVLCLVLLNRIGRRTLHCFTMLLGGISCVAIILPIIFGDQIPDVLPTLGTVFLFATPEHRCAVPGADNDTWESQGPEHDDLVRRTVPVDPTTGTWSQCLVYKHESLHKLANLANDTIECSQWVYSKENFELTFISELNIVCKDKLLLPLLNSILLGGLLGGSLILGTLADMFIPESSRWLVSRGRRQEASAIVRHAALVNKAVVPEKMLSLEDLENDRSGGKFWHLFTNPRLLVRCLIVFFNWFVITGIYYGLGLNVGSLPGDIYLNFLYASIAETLSYVLCLVLLNRIGRRTLHCFTMLLGGISCVAIILPVLFGDQNTAWVATALSMVGKFGISAAFAIIYVYTAELFPTFVRNSIMGASSVNARFGSIASPYINSLSYYVGGSIGVALPPLIFGGSAIVAGLASLWLPETHLRQLPETIEDAENFGKCAVPGADNDTWESQGLEHDDLVRRTVPVDPTTGTWSQCLVYKHESLQDLANLANDTVECSRWVYSKENFELTFISEHREEEDCGDEYPGSYRSDLRRGFRQELCRFCDPSIFYHFIPESPRWLVSRGRRQEASAIVRHAARVNKVVVSEKVLSLQDLQNDGPGVKFWQLFTHRRLLVRCLIVFFNWFIVTCIYYGLGLNVGSLSGDIYLNFLYASIAETLSYVLCLVLLNRIGRRTLHCFTMLLGGISCVAIILPVLFGDQNTAWVATALSMVGKFGISASFAIIYVFTAELFPTFVRNSIVGASSVSARFGSMASPYINSLSYYVSGSFGVALPSLIFGGSAIVAGLASLWLPETHLRQLPETIEDAENFGKKKDKNSYELAHTSSEYSDKKDILTPS